MAFTKTVALYDRISVDGVDMSNAFRSFGFDSTDQDVDVSGFSETGVDETLSGTRSQGFSGEMFVTSESIDLIWPLHNDRSEFWVSWQKDGLIDNAQTTFGALCQVRTFNPQSTRGQPPTTTVNFKTTDPDGITTS